MDSVTNKVELDNTEEKDYDELLAHCLSLIPVKDIIEPIVGREIISNIISFLRILYGEDNSSKKLEASLKIEHILDKLNIISPKEYVELDGYSLIEFAFSKKICELRRKNKNYRRLLFAYIKIDAELCKIIPNLVLKKIKYSVIENQYKYFYRDGQPPNHIKVQMYYRFSIFRGDESEEEIEQIHNTWHFPCEKLVASEIDKSIYDYKGRTFRRGAHRSVQCKDIYKKIAALFAEHDFTRNFLCCSFTKGQNVYPLYHWELASREPQTYTNHIYEKKYYSNEEIPYTPVLYEINISFREQVKKSNKHIDVIRLSPTYISDELPDILQTLRIKRVNYSNSRVRDTHCSMCGLHQDCNFCYGCERGGVCSNRECMCNLTDSSDSSDSSYSSDSSDYSEYYF